MKKQLFLNMKRASLCFISILQLLTISSISAQTGKWAAVKTLAPHECNGGLSLLTNGTVICHNINGGGNGYGWDRLTPDASGSYANGTWDTIASMINERLYFSSQVLPSGNVYVAGGEYGSGGPWGEVYDPLANTWTLSDSIPSGWSIYDGNSEILYNGTVLEGPQIGSSSSYNNLIWTPATNKYTSAPNSLYNHDEAAWLKLPDSSILFVGIASTNANRYIPQTNTWIPDASVPGNLYDPSGEEAGGALLLPDGRAIFFGATGYNAIYTPSGNTGIGSWQTIDSFPVINGTRVGTPDAPCAMMVNGHILCAVSPTNPPASEFAPPVYFVEYDYITGKFTQVRDTIPGFGGNDSMPSTSYQINMIDLPDGNVLVSNYQSSSYSYSYLIYSPGSGPIPQGKPTINSIIPGGCPDYKITGTLFNGISEGAAYGDDWQMETNYPIVRLTNGTNVYYARTSNWNRIGAVQTGALKDTADFSLPPALPAGTYSLVVIANGFASDPVTYTTFSASATVNNVPCNGGTGSATAIAAGGLSPYSYAWTPSGATSATASGLSIGTYTVTITDANGCALTSSVVVTQPAALTVITDSVATSFPDGCNGKASVITSGGTSPYTYSWSPGGQTTDSINGQCPGTYCCIVTDHNGCSQTNCIEVITGIEQLSVASGRWSVYPNPNNGIFTIAGTQNFVSGVEVYNVFGQLIYSSQPLTTKHYPLDLSSQPNGVYFYRVIREDGRVPGSGKIIIQR